MQVPPLKILKASAGSGKTFALTVHFLSILLSRPSSYKEVLALTFTNKATAEMKSRILGVLHALATHADDESTQAYRDEIAQVFPSWSTTEIQSRADQSYRKILHDYSRFSVQTIDGFSQQVIRGFTYELGLDGAFRIEMNSDMVRKDLIKRLYERMNDQEDLLNWLLERIMLRVEENKAWSINEELYKLSSILFSEDFRTLEQVVERPGQEDLFERVAASNKRWILDFQKHFERYVAQMTGIINNLGISPEDLHNKSKNPILKLPTLNFDKDVISKNIDAFQKVVGDINSYQTEKKRGANVEQLFQQLDPVLREFLDFVQKQMAKYNLVLAIDDNIHYLKLLKVMADSLVDWRRDEQAQLISDAQFLLGKIGRNAVDDPTFIWEKIGNRYRYFLFDEFQDTSHAQWNNLSPLLINAIGSGGGKLPEHLVVGDVKQSIYRWRDGDFRILLDGVERTVANAFHLSRSQLSEFISIQNLEVNYRSEKEIINFNNFLYTSLPRHIQELINEGVQESLSESEYQLHWKEKGFEDTIVRAYEGVQQQIPLHKQDRSGGGVYVEFLRDEKGIEEGKPGIFTMPAFKAQACERLYLQLVEWLKSGKYRPGDIGILVRKNDEAILLVDYLTQRQQDENFFFPVISGDALLLSAHPSIRTLVATLQFMAYEGPTYNSALATLGYYFAKANHKQLTGEEWIKFGNGQIAEMQGILPDSLVTNWNSWRQLPLPVLIDTLIGSFEFGADHTALPYLLGFRDCISRLVGEGRGSLQQFLQFWEEEKEKLPLPESQASGAVEILTVHKSKGLAYKAVMMPFCTWALDGKSGSQVWFDVSDTEFADFERIPLAYTQRLKNSTLFPQFYQEQLYCYMDALNTLYVATTRAKEQLWMLAPDPIGTKIDKDVSPKTIGNLLFKVVRDAEEFSRGGSEEEPLCYGVGLQGSPTGLPAGSSSLEAIAANFTQGVEAQYSSSPLNETEEQTPVLRLEGYPTSTYLSDLLSISDRSLSLTNLDDDVRAAASSRSSESRPSNWSPEEKSAASFSNVLHELMAAVRKPEDLEVELQRVCVAGLLSERHLAQAKEMIENAWNHHELGPILRSGRESHNERAIIDADGRTWRPDKVFITEEETLVIDFKLSSAILDEKHIQQVKRYVDLMNEMGSPRVIGYLYYFIQKELIPVTSGTALMEASEINKKMPAQEKGEAQEEGVAQEQQQENRQARQYTQQQLFNERGAEGND